MKYRIKNGLLLLYSDNGFVVKKEELFINGAVIKAIGDSEINDADSYEVIDAEGKLVMPGLINSHTHIYMNFMKNSADDVPFDTWLYKRIFPVEAKMSGTDFYWGTMLGLIEMIKTGTTCYLDMHISENESARAAHDACIRGFIGKCITGNDLYSDAKACFEKALCEKEKYESDLMKFVLSPHSVYACSDNLLKQISNEAQKRNMLKHIHLSETDREVAECISKHKKTPVALLDSMGFLDSKTIAAHCVSLSEQDFEILKEKKVNVATNPCSNAKLVNGYAFVTEMLAKNINVCLGTDSAASNNTLNMFREMGFFSLLHKAVDRKSGDLTSDTVLKCATINPAKALGMQGKIGAITKGAFADLLFIDLNSVSLFPNNNIVSSLCYSANGSEVDSVMIGGKLVMKNKELLTIDTERVYYEINSIKNKCL